jgi:type I restriction enzyme S subunit
VQDGQIDTTGAACIDELPQRMKEGCVLQIGDALLSLTGNVGRVGIVCENGLLLNQRVAKIVPHRKELLPLLYFIYRQPSTKTQLESIAKGTAQLNLSPVETLKLTVPYNSEVALNLSHTLTPIYQAIIANNQQRIILASMRDALLPKLMSGEIDVTGIGI